MNQQSVYLRYLIDIRRPGLKFRSVITNYDIGHLPNITQEKLIQLQDFIYKESGQQIFDEMTFDQNQFLRTLVNMPRFKYYDQYEVLFQDSNIREIFTNAFREFAFELMQVTFMHVPIDVTKTFFLESIGLEYMSIITHPVGLHR